MMIEYNGGLTREQFLFFEIRTIANYLCRGLSREEILHIAKQENLFQFPTERMVTNIVKVCFKRIDAINSQTLVGVLAYGSIDDAKQVNLYAMMKYNRVVWDFMTTVIAEKFRTRQLDFSRKDLNVFFLRLCEQNDAVASWSDTTQTKIKQVLTKSLVECGFIDSIKASELNSILIAPELEMELRAAGEYDVLQAFNCFS